MNKSTKGNISTKEVEIGFGVLIVAVLIVCVLFERGLQYRSKWKSSKKYHIKL